jgi:hypothetical protein
MYWIELFILALQQLPPLGVATLIFFIAYVENIFPPWPGDLLVVFAGTIVGIGRTDSPEQAQSRAGACGIPGWPHISQAGICRVVRVAKELP